MKFLIIFFITVFVQAAPEKSLEQNILQIEKDIAEAYAKISVNNQAIATAKKQISDINQNIEDKKKVFGQTFISAKKH